MKSLLVILPTLLPIVYAWSEQMEKTVLEKGQPLTQSQMEDARHVGVRHPEKIRLLQVDKLPRPESEDFLFAAQQMGLYGARTNGVGAGYGICLLKRYWNDRYTLVHECVHVSQMERLQGSRPFLNEYFRQCVEPGYPFGQLEQEAVHTARALCKNSGLRPPST